MAKQTILICDWCPRHRNAVATLALTNGRATRSDPSLDLCKKHVREAHKLFKPRGKHSATPPRHPLAREGKKSKRRGNYGKKERYKSMWMGRTSAVLDFIKAHGPVTPIELRKLKLKPAPLYSTLRMLKAEKKIKRTGWSKGARWSLA